MARTDLNDAEIPIWISCPIPSYRDEDHLILPSTREHLQYVSTKSMVKEFENGQIVLKSDTEVFTVQWIKKFWLGWKNVGIVHKAEKDGQGNVIRPARVEDPAECTLDNRLLLANARGIAFLLWLQEASRDLGLKTDQQRDEEQDRFRPADQVPLGQAES